MINRSLSTESKFPLKNETAIEINLSRQVHFSAHNFSLLKNHAIVICYISISFQTKKPKNFHNQTKNFFTDTIQTSEPLTL